mmetsp:Transcript_18540/g.20684  ORF Transcript_18540/g.20684 Transcript_18540/m.20684 type:complete len:89 (+) Transcript_18540:329-595(+)
MLYLKIQLKEKLNREMAEEYAKRNKLIFLDEVSAKLDIGVNESFDFLINMVHQTQMELVQQNKKPLNTLRLTIEKEIEISRKKEQDKC